MAINKVIYDGQSLIDLTEDTVTADKLAYGYTAHNKAGVQIVGSNTYDADTSDGTIYASEILANKVAYARGSRIVGEMPNKGAVQGTISSKAEQYTVPLGFHDGSGKVSISSAEQNKIIATNIKSGITILGVEGSYTGEAILTQTKTVTPTTSSQYITADSAYDYLAAVTVYAIPYAEASNAAGGLTVTIG